MRRVLVGFLAVALALGVLTKIQPRILHGLAVRRIYWPGVDVQSPSHSDRVIDCDFLLSFLPGLDKLNMSQHLPTLTCQESTTNWLPYSQTAICHGCHRMQHSGWAVVPAMLPSTAQGARQKTKVAQSTCNRTCPTLKSRSPRRMNQCWQDL